MRARTHTHTHTVQLQTQPQHQRNALRRCAAGRGARSHDPRHRHGAARIPGALPQNLLLQLEFPRHLAANPNSVRRAHAVSAGTRILPGMFNKHFTATSLKARRHAAAPRRALHKQGKHK